MQKTCTKCKESKLLDDFHTDKSCKDGRRGICKLCRNKECRSKPRSRKKPEQPELTQVKWQGEHWQITKVVKKADKWGNSLPDNPVIEQPVVIHEVAKSPSKVDFPTQIAEINPPRAGSYQPNPIPAVTLHSPKKYKLKSGKSN